MTKIQQMKDAGLPVIESESDEASGSYSFTSLTEEQMEIYHEILGLEKPTEQRFNLPIVTPRVTAGEYVEAPEFIVASPKPQDTAKKAHAKAVELSKLPKKRLAEIVLNLIVYVEDLEKRLENKGI